MTTVETFPNSSSSSSEDEKMNIYLKVTKTVPLKVTKSDSVRKLKAAMREKEGIPENFQQLHYGGKFLKDDENLDDCGIQENSTLHLVLQTSGVVKLLVKISSTQKNIELEAKIHDSVLNIKLMIQTKEGIDSSTYSLLYAGKILEDSKTLASLDIKDEATLNLVFDPREVVTLSIKRPTGEIVKIEVKVLYTIRDVKEIVDSMFGLRASDHDLVYGGKTLEDFLTLASYNINEESILEILRQRHFQIFVKLFSGQTLTLDVCEEDTVACLKGKILQKIGNQVKFLGCCYFVYAGKCLRDSQDLAGIGVEKHSTLYVNPRLSASLCSFKLSELEAPPTPTISIGSLKHLISKKLEEPVKEVLHEGHTLHDDYTLLQYGIKEDTELTIVIENRD